jgi:uroporphyrinogen decarboxylase
MTEKPLLAALAGKPSACPPIWLMRQAGRYLPEYRALRAEAGSFLDLCLVPDRAVEITLQPIRRFGFDAAILFSDILMIPYGLGQGLDFKEGEGPVLPPVVGAAGLAALASSVDLERLAPVFETLRRLRQDLPPEVTLIGFAGAPWTIATYMVEGRGGTDFGVVKAWALGDPEGFQALIDRITDATVAYLDAQIVAGAEVVQLFESWAGVLDGPAFERWVVAPNRRIVAALNQRHPGVPIIVFPRGAGFGYRTVRKALPGVTLALDQTVSLDWMAEAAVDGPVQGNLDPQRLLIGGAALQEGASAILEAMRGKAFVFNLGHGVTPPTPIAHVQALVDLVRKAI